jgi:hypothetical protein
MPPEPIGYRGFVAFAPSTAVLRPLHVDSASFTTAAEARAWVEEARGFCGPNTDFAGSVVPVFSSYTCNDDEEA